MDDKVNPIETADEFLKALGAKLEGTEGVDVDLAAILTTHLLKEAPTQNAVLQAKNAITDLAIQRANPAKPEVGDV